MDGKVFQAEKNGHKIAIKFVHDIDWPKNIYVHNAHLVKPDWYEMLGDILPFSEFKKLNPKSKVLIQEISGMPRKCCGNINCVAMDLVEGRDLAEIMKDHGLVSARKLKFQPNSLKPIDVNLVKLWLHQALEGFVDLEKLNLANLDQHLRNVMWDEKNRQLKLVDFTRVFRMNHWFPHVFEVKGLNIRQSETHIPQEWEYLGYFLPKENQKQEYFNFLKTLHNTQTATEALAMATRKDGYLTNYKKDVTLNAHPWSVNHNPNMNPPMQNNPYPPTESSKKKKFPTEIVVSCCILAFIGAVVGIYFCFCKKNKKNQPNRQFETRRNQNPHLQNQPQPTYANNNNNRPVLSTEGQTEPNWTNNNNNRPVIFTEM